MDNFRLPWKWRSWWSEAFIGNLAQKLKRNEVKERKGDKKVKKEEVTEEMIVQDEEVTLVISKEVMKEVKHNINPKKLRDSGAVVTWGLTGFPTRIGIDFILQV